jgi:Tfp pilus assembly protein PilZ
MARRLRLPFADATAFREEFERNIVKGGAFVRTTEAFEARDLVEVELELGFRGDSVVLEAEVVHRVGPEQAGSEAGAGVAVQFLEPAPLLRDTLQRFLDGGASAEVDSFEPLENDFFGRDDVVPMNPDDLPEPRYDGEASETAFFDPSEVDLPAIAEEAAPSAEVPERRKARRVQTRVQARVDANSISLEGRTRDLSEAGALVSADASGLPVGKDVTLELVHPDTGEQVEIEGTVSRHVETEGTVAAVGIEFGAETSGDEVGTFVEDVSQAEEERQRNGIYGAIGELGIATVVRMLATNAKRGTLTVISGAEDGSMGFENGILRHVQLGETRGVKALSRLLSWERGRFEFHAQLEPVDGDPLNTAVEEAIQQATHQREDLVRIESTDLLDPAACFKIDAEALRSERGLTKTEEAVLDLVAVRFSVRRILDVIPQPDAEVIEALRNLLDGKIIQPV